MAEKTATCQPNTIQALLAALRKLQEGLLAMRWIREPIVPAEWAVDGHNVPRGAYSLEDAEAIIKRVGERKPEYAQALRFILANGARIDEVFHLRVVYTAFGARQHVSLYGLKKCWATMKRKRGGNWRNGWGTIRIGRG